MKKTAIVTGANTGMGKETARELARQGMRVAMACRSAEKGETARAEIFSETGNGDLEVMVLDLGSRDSIRGFAEDFLSRHDRLDVLVNNAGLSLQERSLSLDGIETTFAVNHLGPFLLTNLLLDLLEKSAPSRIVNVASMVHKNARFDIGDPEMKDGWAGYTAYANSKLMNILFTAELSRRLAGTGVTVNSLNPGLVNSEFFRNYKRMPFMLRVVKKLIGKTPVQGAKTAVYLASSSEVEGVSGLYFSDGKAVEASPMARDEVLASKLWDLSARYTKLKKA